jgi:FAD/FMN-containing dehydrogenase
LFIGSEGTLGIITAAVVKIFPKPHQRATFFTGLNSPADALALLGKTRAAFGDAIQAFEIIPRASIELANAVGPHCVDPLGVKTPWHILGELTGVSADTVTGFLQDMLNAGVILDATLAQNEKQRADLWFMREAIVEAQRNAGGSIKHDISLPVSSIPDFIARADARVRALVPGVRPMIFGHVGDGNLHFNLTQPVGMDRAAYLARWDDINHAVHDIVVECRGSIAAEHGVGVFKAAELAQRKTAVELNLMKTVKAALDPKGLMNPGKILL